MLGQSRYPAGQSALMAPVVDEETPLAEPMKKGYEDAAQTATTRGAQATFVMHHNFVRRAYVIFFCQLMVSLVIATIFTFQEGAPKAWIRSNEWVLWLLVFLTFGSACCMVCCSEGIRRPPWNVFWLCTLTLCQGIMLGFASVMFLFETVMLSYLVIACTFLFFVIYSLQAGDFEGYTPYFYGYIAIVFFILVLGVIASLCGALIESNVLFIDALFVFGFTTYVVYDTQLMLGLYGGHRQQLGPGDGVYATLLLYMDIVSYSAGVLSYAGKAYY